MDLSCSADHEVISTKKSILQNHCKSKQHTRGKETLFTFKMEVLKDEGRRLKSNTLYLEERAFRVQVVENFLKPGFPLRNVDNLRNLFERGEHRLTHLRQRFRLILKQETET